MPCQASTTAPRRTRKTSAALPPTPDLGRAAFEAAPNVGGAATEERQ
jgi:hypothetical protein